MRDDDDDRVVRGIIAALILTIMGTGLVIGLRMVWRLFF